MKDNKVMLEAVEKIADVMREINKEVIEFKAKITTENGIELEGSVNHFKGSVVSDSKFHCAVEGEGWLLSVVGTPPF